MGIGLSNEQGVEILEALLLNTPFGVLLVDQRGKCYYSNPQFTRITGYSAQEIKATRRCFRQAFPSVLLRHQLFKMWKHRFSTEPFDYDYDVRCRDGKTKQIRFWRTVLKDGRYVILLSDITLFAESEGRLKTAQDRFFASIEFLPDATFVVDNKKQVVAWNKAVEEMTGTTKSQMIGKGDYAYAAPFYGEPRPMLIDLVGTPDEELEATYTAIERRGKTLFGENYVPSLYGGRGGHLLGAASFLYDSDGNVVGAIETVKDITDRKRTEAELQLRNVLLSTQQETSIDGILVVDEEGHIISFNRRFVELWGVPAELIQAGADDPVLQFVAAQIADPQSFLQRVLYLYDHKEETSRDELPLADGRVFDRYSAPMWGPGDRYYGRVWYFKDMTEYKRAQEALRQSEETFRALAENSPDMIARLDREGRHLYANPKIEGLAGIPAHQLIGKTFREIVIPEEMAAVLETTIGTVFSTGRLERRELQLPSGAWFDWLYMPERGADGTVKAVVTAARDITELKNAEAEHARTNEKLSAWVRELEDNSRDAAILSEMADFLQTCRTTEEAYKVVTYSARNLFPTDSGAVCAVSPSRNLVEAVSIWGTSFESERVFAPHDCWALRRGKAHHVPDIHSGLLCDHLGQAPTGGYLCIPMTAHGETLGVLHIRTEAKQQIDGHAFDRLTESKRRLAIAMAEHIALALANLRLKETLHRQAIRDPLTGLYNRRHMEESLEREVHRASRRESPLSVIMIDLDHFKDFNDTFGHSAGDALLQEMGIYFQESIRGEDLACRFGGEEFVLILPDATAEDAAQRIEELLVGVTRLRVEYRGQPLAAPTFSAGVASLPRHGSTVEILLQSADRALYRAKTLGRKRVVIAEAHLSVTTRQGDNSEALEARL